jgi:hypothetical protein
VPRPRGRRDLKMRMPDEILKCVGFVAEVLSSDGDAESVDRVATGFFVRTPSLVFPTRYFFYFATAKHLALDLKNKKSAVIVNTKEGGVAQLKMAPFWTPHPIDDSIDIALTPCALEDHYDVKPIPTSLFFTREKMEKGVIGIGDETVTVGLFTPAPGIARNQPIIRIGNIAMLPGEPVQVEGKFSEVYLVEARSIGGMSGSPVFLVRHEIVKSETLDGKADYAYQAHYGLLGLMHGHWDIRESDINSPRFVQDRRNGVNMGIAVVVPAQKIAEAINHPELLRLRVLSDLRASNRVSPGPDSKVVE